MDALRRLELGQEIALANEEAARLSEMVLILGPQLDDARLRQLRIELVTANQRAKRLAEELSLSGPNGSAAA